MSFTEEVLPALERIKELIPGLEVGSPWRGGVYARIDSTYVFATHDQKENDINFSVSHGQGDLHEAAVKKASIYVIFGPKWLERMGIAQLIKASRKKNGPVSFEHVVRILEILLDNRERIVRNYDAMMASGLPERGKILDGRRQHPRHP